MENLKEGYRYPKDIKISKDEINQLALDLLNTTWHVKSGAVNHIVNLKLIDWAFVWGVSKTSLGTCNYRKKCIYVSELWYNVNPERARDWEDVLRHEIAHALTYIITKTTGHTWLWRNMAKQVLSTPKRVSKTMNKIQTKYMRYCPCCGFTSSIHRMSETPATYACVSCCNTYNNGKYDPTYQLQVKLNPNFKK